MENYGLPDAKAIESNWHGTSHFPERRAVAAIAGARELLERFRAFVDQVADQGGAIDAAAEFETYRQRTLSLHRRAWAVQGGCVSWFIAGPSNFNNRRAEKRFNSRDKAYGEIDAHATAARKAVTRRAWPHGHPDGPIRGSNPDAPELLRAKIDKAEAMQAKMRLVNQVIRQARPKTPEAQAEAVLLCTGWSWPTCQRAVQPDELGRVGFASFELTNNLANIKRMKLRLAVIEARRTQGDSSSTHETAAGRVTMECDTAADRVRLIFPGKPSDKVRGELKGRGFRWSPTAGAWQRHLNGAGVQAARFVLATLGQVEA